ncbi:VCBS domain-containing protein [Actinoplanes sp. ATCC 53533]|uniref:VCBS domain-containing protein n=1 Tax=Actinoplanes sp. ATCC 53533 TaxID=1288362 RepID=UPI0013153FE4|nr:VCBS domain-containing protein [Actinoplanes sp. ATCC 53533]
MTTSIDRDARDQAMRPSETEDGDAGSITLIMRGVWVFTAVTSVASIALITVGIAQPSIHTTIAAATALILATASGSLLVGESMLADHQVFYQRGQLDGWHSGYRMLPPDVNDPLLRE